MYARTHVYIQNSIFICCNRRTHSHRLMADRHRHPVIYTNDARTHKIRSKRMKTKALFIGIECVVEQIQNTEKTKLSSTYPLSSIYCISNAVNRPGDLTRERKWNVKKLSLFVVHKHTHTHTHKKQNICVAHCASQKSTILTFYKTWRKKYKQTWNWKWKQQFFITVFAKYVNTFGMNLVDTAFVFTWMFIYILANCYCFDCYSCTQNIP